jgi:hypothetical protein
MSGQWNGQWEVDSDGDLMYDGKEGGVIYRGVANITALLSEEAFAALVELVRSHQRSVDPPSLGKLVLATELLVMDPLPTKVNGQPCLFVGSSLDGVTGQLVGVHVSPVEESSPLVRHKMSTYAPTTIVEVVMPTPGRTDYPPKPGPASSTLAP